MDTRAAAVPLLDRLLEPLSQCVQGEDERALLGLRADPILQKRIDELAQRCDEGILSETERDEYQTYVRFGNFIAILQAKARIHQQNLPVAK